VVGAGVELLEANKVTYFHIQAAVGAKMSIPFYGQYMAGFKTDGIEGHLTVNVDEDKNGQGVAYLVVYGQNPQNFSIFDCKVSLSNEGVISGTAQRSLKHEATHRKNTDALNESASIFSFEIFCSENPNRIVYEQQGVKHEQTLHSIISGTRAETKNISTWKEFKAWVDSIRSSDRGAIFRGVARSCYGLKTSFHRTGRVDLERYRDVDLPVFRDLAETIGGLKLAGTPDDNGALWGFAQHHGFPTPLLDWTESPYIAAYFAFSERLEHQNPSDEETVRIYYLSGQFVESNRPLNLNLSDVFPRVWVFKPNSKGNQRLVFQQGLFLLSNIVDIEAYLMSLPLLGNAPNISAIEMPASLAREAIDELGYMGVSHLSLFPGLDGAAKHAAFKQFYQPDSVR
jgi:hypothetical protein